MPCLPPGQDSQAPPGQLPTQACGINTVHTNLVGLLLESQGYRYLLMCCDRTTRWLKAIPLSSIDAATVTDACMSNWVCRFGIPANIVTDQGLQFTSRTFTTSLEALGSRVHTTTAYPPQSNRMIERTH